ncbi:MAG: sigma-70 family RNA polymerase sigma factor [Elusimicrobiota bacterium]
MEQAKEIVERYTPYAYSVAFHLTGNQAAAGDLVQNAMLRVLKSFHTYDPSYKVEQWLYRIIRNLFIDRLRQEKRRKEDPLERGPEEERRSYAETLVDPGPTPEDAMERRDQQEAVRNAMKTLPPEMRVAVALVDLEGYAYDEAAKILEIPASTLGVRVFRGRKLLRKNLASFIKGRKP